MRVILIILIFLFQTVFGAEVNNFSDLYSALSDGDGNLEIESEITLEDNLGSPPCDLNIEGNDNMINGDNKYGGFILDKGKSFFAQNLYASNFMGEEGGVVDNREGCSVRALQGHFCNNEASVQGGVISNNSNADIISGQFEENSANFNGGAVFNGQEGVIGKIEGVFKENEAKGGFGGAICNIGKIGSIEADFEENNSFMLGGGAIYNTGSIKSISGNFIGNSVREAIVGGGGAIFNSGNIGALRGSFLNNTTKDEGGAIYNMYGVINFISDQAEIEFTGNRDKGGLNAIHNVQGTINFEAKDYDIVINDSITGGIMDTLDPFFSFGITLPNKSIEDIGDDSVININPSSEGRVVLNNVISSNTVNMQGGTLKIGKNTQDGEEYFGNFDKTSTFNFYSGLIDLMNNNTQNTNFGNLNLYSDMDVVLDIDFEKRLSDTISANSFNQNGHNINIKDFNIQTPATDKNYSFYLIGKEGDEAAADMLAGSLRYTGDEIVNLPIYKYKAWYDNVRGFLNFSRLDNEFNPGILVSPVATQLSGYLVQLNSYDNAFRNMDMYNIKRNFKNRYSYLGDKYTYLKDEGFVWSRPYSLFENVSLKNGPDVSNVGYGSFFGYESNPFYLKKGFSLISGPYFGYNGSHQAYEGEGIYQNGGTIGALSLIYKGGFYFGLTANVSANAGKSSEENFSMLMTGAALKTGFNIPLFRNKLYIQPSYLMSYTFAKTFDHETKGGINITSKPLNAIQISPGLKMFANLKEGFQPYLEVRMVWNAIDKTLFKANDVTLPELSIRPFVVYGAGIRKSSGERFRGFIQAYVTNGGRTGVGLQAGLSWML